MVQGDIEDGKLYQSDFSQGLPFFDSRPGNEDEFPDPARGYSQPEAKTYQPQSGDWNSPRDKTSPILPRARNQATIATIPAIYVFARPFVG